jgi:hypothetical protein
VAASPTAAPNVANVISSTPATAVASALASAATVTAAVCAESSASAGVSVALHLPPPPPGVSPLEASFAVQHQLAELVEALTAPVQPRMQAAREAINLLRRADVVEMKNMKTPPRAVAQVMEVVLPPLSI